MANVRLDGMRVAILLGDNFEQVEMTEPRKALDAAGYPTLQDDVRNAGGTWLNIDVVRDRNLVTSRQPSDIPAFNSEMLPLFAEYREHTPLRRAA